MVKIIEEGKTKILRLDNPEKLKELREKEGIEEYLIEERTPTHIEIEPDEDLKISINGVLIAPDIEYIIETFKRFPILSTYDKGFSALVKRKEEYIGIEFRFYNRQYPNDEDIEILKAHDFIDEDEYKLYKYR